MKRKFFSMLLMGAMTIASVGMFTSCKDYDDDINNLQKQIDGITAQKLQDQLTTLQGALTTAQGAAAAAQTTADNAAKAAADAAQAAKGAQGTADDVAKAADAAAKAAEAAQATADLCAKQADVDALKSAIDQLTPIVNGKIGQAELDDAIKAVEAKIAAIDQKLLTIDDVKGLLAEAGFATAAAVEDLNGQISALNKFKEAMEAQTPGVDETWKKSVDEAIASLAGIKQSITDGLAAKADKTDLDAKANQEELNKLVEKMGEAEAALKPRSPS